METITVRFSNIVKMRKFEGALNFVNVQPKVNDEEMTVEVNINDIPKHLKVEIAVGYAAVIFKKD